MKKNGSSVNPFDAIATGAPKTSSSRSTKIAATVTDEIKKAVDIVIKSKAAIAAIEHELADAETTVIAHVRPQQDELARSGNFSKSFSVQGLSGDITYVTSDKFSVPKEPDIQNRIRDLIGKEKFEEYFQTVRTISLKSEVQENTEFIQKLTKAVADAGMSLADAFNVTDVLKTRPDLDRKQYDLPERKLEEFRTLVKQNKPALK